MNEYQQPYLILWNACTDALEALSEQNYGLVKQILISAQQRAEEVFLDEIAED